MTMPRISVVMPVYNRDWCVAEAIESVLETGTPGLELVLVDDGSTDKTPTIMAEYAERQPERVRVFRHPGNENRGIAKSRNLGVAMSRGVFLAFLDSDDLYFPERFKYAIPWLEQYPQLAGCIEPYIVRAYESESASRMEKHLTEVAIESEGWLQAMLLRTTYWSMPAVTLRRAALESYGRFDERLRFAEETSLWIKLAAARALGSAQSSFPVACVRRHTQHSWDPDDRAADRAAFLHVLVDAVRWAQRCDGVTIMARDILRERLRTYVIEILSEPGLPIWLRIKGWTLGAMADPSLLPDRSVLANLLRSPVR